jgi:hypothetical protein
MLRRQSQRAKRAMDTVRGVLSSERAAGGNRANIAASGASNQTERDVRAAQKKLRQTDTHAGSARGAH